MLVEALALIQHRLGLAAAVKLARSAQAFEIEWVARGVTTAFAFDRDFLEEAFQLYGA